MFRTVFLGALALTLTSYSTQAAPKPPKHKNCLERIRIIQNNIMSAVPPMHDDACLSTILAQAQQAYSRGKVDRCLKLVRMIEMRTREQKY